MRIHTTDVAATLVIAAGIIVAHAITDALLGPPAYTATIWVDADKDPLDGLRLSPRLRAPLPPAPVPPPPGPSMPPGQPAGPEDVVQFIPLRPHAPALRVMIVEPSVRAAPSGRFEPSGRERARRRH